MTDASALITYRYLHLPWIGPSAIITAVLRIHPEPDGDKSQRNVDVAFAFCSPRQGMRPGELPFSKRAGRGIARTRLGSKRAIKEVLNTERQQDVVFRALEKVLVLRENAEQVHRIEYSDGVPRGPFRHWVPHWLISWGKEARRTTCPKELTNVIRGRWKAARKDFLDERQKKRRERILSDSQ